MPTLPPFALLDGVFFSSAPPAKRGRVVAAPATSVRAEMVRRMNWLDAKSCGFTFVAYNPKRQKTKAHARWSAYARSKTVQDAVQAGATMRDFDVDLAKGYVTCEGVRPLVPSLAIKDEACAEEPEPLAAPTCW